MRRERMTSGISLLLLLLAIEADAETSDVMGYFEQQITTDTAEDVQPELSPDGSMIAFRSLRSGNGDIWVKPVGGGPPVQITTDAADDAAPSWSPDGSMITFQSLRSGNLDIWVIPADGGTATQLTTHPSADTYPSWSPDGNQIAFSSMRSGNRDIWRTPAGGGPKFQVTTDAADDDQGTWSPDGSLIAFQSTRSGNRDIWTVPFDGGTAVQITTDGAEDRSAAWSADGSEIAFNSDRGVSVDVWIIPSSGGTAAQLTDDFDDDSHPSWAPDGSAVAFMSNRSGNNDVWMIHRSIVADDGAVQVTSDYANDQAPCFSPDGSQIAFSSFRPDGGVSLIWVTSVDGGTDTQISDGLNDVAPSWSPDGSTLAYYAWDGSDYYVTTIPAGGGTPTALTQGLFPTWSPDGGTLAFAETSDIWLIPGDGGTPWQLTTDPDVDAYPSWFADGARVAFASTRSGNWDIWSIPTLGGTATRITTNSADDFHPSCSPNGGLIAFASDRSGNDDIWLIPSSGGTAVQVTTDDGDDVSPNWSRDGTMLTFSSERLDVADGDIWRITLSPTITNVVDVPNDQGRWVRLTWTAAHFDDAGASVPITAYGVYREIDADLRSAGSSSPSDWDFLISVAASTEDVYHAVVPTLADSTGSGGVYYTTFFVRALTSTLGMHFDSAPASGYSVDNLDPLPPANPRWESDVLLAWDESEADDFDYFTVYGSFEDVLDGSADVIGRTSGTSIDVSGALHAFYFVTATDHAGNEGSPTGIEGLLGVPGTPRPTAFVLEPLRPNPFTVATTVRFELPVRGRVDVGIFDASGRRIRTLVDAIHDAGRFGVVWDGRTRDGHAAAGTYFVRLRAPGFTASRKLVLVR